MMFFPRTGRGERTRMLRTLGDAGLGLAQVILDVPDGGALVTVPAGDLGEAVNIGFQINLHQLMMEVLVQVAKAGSKVGVQAVQRPIEVVAH